MNVAEPPKAFSILSNGVATVSKPNEPTTNNPKVSPNSINF
jgi:hypothetical protein